MLTFNQNALKEEIEESRRKTEEQWRKIEEERLNAAAFREHSDVPTATDAAGYVLGQKGAPKESSRAFEKSSRSSEESLQISEESKAPKKLAAEQQNIADAVAADTDKVVESGTDVVSEDGALREVKPDYPRITLKDSYDLKRAARSSGMSRDDRRALDKSLRKIRHGEGEATDWNRLVRVEQMSGEPFSERSLVEYDKYNREIPGSGITKKVAGGDEARAVVSRVVGHAAESVRQDIANGKFESAQDLSDTIEAKTGIPGDAVVKYMRNQEVAQLRKSGQKSLDGPSSAYPILSAEMRIKKAEERQAKRDEIKLRADLASKNTIERMKAERNIKNQEAADALGFNSVQNYRLYKLDQGDKDLNRESAAYWRKTNGTVTEDGGFDAGEPSVPIEEEIVSSSDSDGRINERDIERNMEDISLDPNTMSDDEMLAKLAKAGAKNQRVTIHGATDVILSKAKEVLGGIKESLSEEEQRAVSGEFKHHFPNQPFDDFSMKNIQDLFTTGLEGARVEVAGPDAIGKNLADILEDKMSIPMSEDLRSEIEDGGNSEIDVIRKLYNDVESAKENFIAGVNRKKIENKDKDPTVAKKVAENTTIYDKNGKVNAELTEAVQETEKIYMARNSEGDITSVSPVINMPTKEQDRALLSAINNPDLPEPVRKIVSTAMKKAKSTHTADQYGQPRQQPYTIYDGAAAAAAIKKSGIKRLYLDPESSRIAKLLPEGSSDVLYKIPAIDLARAIVPSGSLVSSVLDGTPDEINSAGAALYEGAAKIDTTKSISPERLSEALAPAFAEHFGTGEEEVKKDLGSYLTNTRDKRIDAIKALFKSDDEDVRYSGAVMLAGYIRDSEQKTGYRGLSHFARTMSRINKIILDPDTLNREMYLGEKGDTLMEMTNAPIENDKKVFDGSDNPDKVEFDKKNPALVDERDTLLTYVNGYALQLKGIHEDTLPSEIGEFRESYGRLILTAATHVDASVAKLEKTNMKIDPQLKEAQETMKNLVSSVGMAMPVGEEEKIVAPWSWSYL